MKSISKKANFSAFTAIRFWWATCVVWSHLYGNNYKNVDLHILDFMGYIGPWAVSNFFVLTGFLLAYQHANTFATQKWTIKQSLSFCYIHIKKFYLLYFICNIPTLIRILFDANIYSINELAEKIIINLFLLQSVKIESVLNFPTWYLSCIMFIYLVMPILLKIFIKIKNLYLLFFFLIITFFWTWFYSLASFASYTSPFYRINQVICGILLYRIYAEIVSKNSKTWLQNLYNKLFIEKTVPYWQKFAILTQIIGIFVVIPYINTYFYGTISAILYIHIFSVTSVCSIQKPKKLEQLFVRGGENQYGNLSNSLATFYYNRQFMEKLYWNRQMYFIKNVF